METYLPLKEIAFDTVKIAFVVGLIIFVGRKMLPKTFLEWLGERPFIINIVAVLLSIGLPFLGAWLNMMSFQPRDMVEYAWIGFFSAGIHVLGYEGIKNVFKEVIRRRNDNS